MKQLAPRPRAFTLTELLVVIAIFVLILAIAVPAFSSLIYSTERASAENALRVGLAGAREAALRSVSGRDAAAVIVHEPGGKCSIHAMVQVGRMIDDVDRNNQPVERDVFVGAEGVSPVELPGVWTVAGFAPANTVDDPGSPAGQTFSGWYEHQNYPGNRPNWVLPETGYYRSAAANTPQQLGGDGANRQTFMVRFEGGTGQVKSWDTSVALVLLPSRALAHRGTAPWNQYNPTRAADQEAFVRRVLAISGSSASQTRRQVLGDVATDTALARPVGQLAVFSLRRLAAGIGARGLNRKTGTIYADAETVGRPEFDTALFPSGTPSTTISTRMNEWISGVTEGADSQVFGLDRYAGGVRPLARIGGTP